MALPIVLILLAGYWVIALFFVRRARSRGLRYAMPWAWTLFALLFFGDHVAGYLCARIYSAFISVPGPVSLVIRDMAVENYDQDAAQSALENANSSGLPPIFGAWNAAMHLATPVQYSHYSGGSSLGDITTGLSRLEIIDLRYQQLNPNAAPRVTRVSIVMRPDPRCEDFEVQSRERREAQYKSMKAHGLIDPEKYCIAREVDHKVTARYTVKSASADYFHPRHWTLPALAGTYLNKTQIVDNQTGKVVFEIKGATFYGGWVWQLVRFLPDVNYKVSSGGITTQGLSATCCRNTRIPGINLLPYEVSP